MLKFLVIIGSDRSSLSSRESSLVRPIEESPNSQDGHSGSQHLDTPRQANPPEQSEEKVEEESALDPEILEVIGKRLTSEKVFGEAIHQDVAVRWLDVLKQGLPKDEKVELIKRYPTPQNCTLFDPPKLNQEFSMLLNDVNKKRDNRILAKQSKISAALGALSKATSALLKTKDPSLLGYVSDAARLIADIQRDETSVRRNLIIASYGGQAKDILQATESGEWLFGEDLTEKLKAAKALDGPLKVLKDQSKTEKTTVPKNSKAPPKHTPAKQQNAGGKSFRKFSRAGRQSPSRKRTPPRSRSPRRSNRRR